jgi:hypothetical protein
VIDQWLAWVAILLSPQATEIDLEPPRAAAAVSFAAASMTREESPPAPPAPPTPPPAPDNKCCSDCGGSGWVVQPDGHRTPCPCPDSCECRQRNRGRADCPRCLGLGVVAVWTADERWLEPCKCCKR